MGPGVAGVGFWRQERALRIGGDWGGWALGGMGAGEEGQGQGQGSVVFSSPWNSRGVNPVVSQLSSR